MKYLECKWAPVTFHWEAFYPAAVDDEFRNSVGSWRLSLQLTPVSG